MKRILLSALPLSLALLAPASCGSDGFTPTQDAATTPGETINIVEFDLDAGTVPSCATSSKEAERLPLDMAIGLDTSFSMDFYGKWPAVQAALKAFIKNPAYSDLGLSLQFFPIRKTCSVADYKVPVVPMTLLAGAAGPISSALDAQKMSGGTPMVPLLEGLGGYLKELNATRPKRKPVIVLATDGFPDDTCTGAGGGTPNTLENAVKVTESARAGTPAIDTFVIGVGSELKSLDAIAAAGGTKSAVLVDTNQNVEKAFLDALDAIRKQAIPCSYDIPNIGGGVDPSKVNVSFTPASGKSELFLYTTNAEGCAKAPTSGWYFDDPVSPKKVVFCETACNRVKADDKGRIDVFFGCKRQEASTIL